MPVSVLGRVPVNRGDILPVNGSLLPVTAGLQLWLRADMGVTLNDETAGAPNDFVSVWTLGATTVTPNAFVDPLGGTQASAVVASAVNTTHYLQQTIGNRVSGVLETWTVYVKAGALTWCAFGDNTGAHWAFFNLIAGVIGVQVGLTAATITSAGNGWWKVTVSSTGFNQFMGIFLAVSDNVYTPFAGDGVSNSIYLFGCTASQPKVSAWADQSGQGHNAVQATAVSQPFWNPVGLNGKSSILWDGINDSMAANGLAAMMNGTDLPFTLIVVGHYVTLTASVQPVCWSYSASGAPFQRWVLDGSLNYNTSRRDDAATVATGVGPLAATVPPVVMTEVFHGTTDQFFVSGVPRAGDPAPMAVGVISLMDRFTLGAIDIGGPTAFANFLIAEVIVYSTALSTADRQAVEAYLYQRYGIGSFIDPRSLPDCSLWLRADAGLTLSNPTILAANAFSSATWFKGATSVVADATTDPFGGTLADSVVEDLSNGNHYIFQFITNRVAGLPETVSLYAKAGTRSWLALGDDTGLHWAFVDLATGALGTVTGATATVTDAGNGWWLIKVTSTGFDGAFTCFMATGNNGNSYVGNGVGNIYLYGADVSQPTVSSWADQSGFAHNVTQATKANQPFWVASAQNGLPGVRLDGIDDWLESAATGFAANTAHTISAAVKPLALLSKYSGFCGMGSGVPSGDVPTSFLGLDNTDKWWYGGANVGNPASAATAVAGAVVTLAKTTDGTTTTSGYRNNILDAGPSAFPYNINPSTYVVGRYDAPVPGGVANADVMEMIVYLRVLTAPEMALIQVYLKSRYATP
jgi:hypothetical protein